jgi:hypothetical protein
MSVVLVNRRAAFAGIAAAVWASASGFASTQLPQVTVHKDPGCGCCGGWADHLKTAGFPVTIVNATDLAAVRKRFGVPENLAGCHTAEMAGYIVEGHVPAIAIKRLLTEKPPARGLAVPGMPLGSPGMDGPPELYEVILFGPQGRRSYGKFRGAEPVRA